MARAARRREAVQVLRVAASTADYAARQAGNGQVDDEARDGGEEGGRRRRAVETTTGERGDEDERGD